MPNKSSHIPDLYRNRDPRQYKQNPQANIYHPHIAMKHHQTSKIN